MSHVPYGPPDGRTPPPGGLGPGQENIPLPHPPAAPGGQVPPPGVPGYQPGGQMPPDGTMPYPQSQGHPAGPGYPQGAGYPMGHGHPPHVPPAGWGPGPPGGPGSGPPRPKKSRKGLIAVVIVAVLVLATAVAVPLVLRAQEERERQAAEEEERRAAQELERQQREEADEAAEDFMAALAAHEQTWNDAALADTYGSDVAGTLGSVDHDSTEAITRTSRLTLSRGATVLNGACAGQEEAVASFAVLEGHERPVLAEVPGTSSQYEEAEVLAAESAALAEAEEQFLTEGRDLAGQVLDHCGVWAAGFDGFAELNGDFIDGREALAVEDGATTTEGNWTLECLEEDGCLPLERDDRNAYADLVVGAHQDWLDHTTTMFTDACLPGYENYCEAEIVRAQAEHDEASTVMDHFRDPLTGDEAFAEYAQAEGDWHDNSEQRREETLEILRDIDGTTDAGAGGLYAGHQQSVIGEWEDRIEELARATLGEVSTDEV